MLPFVDGDDDDDDAAYVRRRASDTKPGLEAS